MGSKNNSGWLHCKLGQLIEVKHGFALKGQFFSSSGSYIVLTPGNFYDEGGFKSKGSKEKYYTGNVPDWVILNKNDLLIAMTEQAEGLLGSAILVQVAP